VKRPRSQSRKSRLHHHKTPAKHGRKSPKRKLKLPDKSQRNSAPVPGNNKSVEPERSLLTELYRLQLLAWEADLPTSRRAFDELMSLLHQLIDWLYVVAVLPAAALGSLSRTLPEKNAITRFKRGQHVAAWAGTELAWLYKQFKAELASRSSKFVNRLRYLRSGFRVGHHDSPPNVWFCSEYKRTTDYRPRGRMAVWVATKIEEIRQLKTARYWRQFASKFVNGPAPSRLEDEREEPLRLFSPPALVRGAEFFQQLDGLPTFGGPESDLQAWRSFVRGRLLKQKQIMTEFELLFPRQRKKLDGLITTTLRRAWKAAKDRGSVIVPR
jgi:hypothetical protein